MVPTPRFFGSLGRMKLITALSTPILALSLTISQPACAPPSPNSPTFTSVEDTILKDIKIVGETVEKIEADVAPFLPAGSDVVAVVDDALSFLADLGLIPAPNLPAAQAMHAKLSAQRGAPSSAPLKGFVAPTPAASTK